MTNQQVELRLCDAFVTMVQPADFGKGCGHRSFGNLDAHLHQLGLSRLIVESDREFP